MILVLPYDINLTIQFLTTRIAIFYHVLCILNDMRLQVFVANPNKPRPILEILLRNKDKLVEFLTNFHNDRSDDEQFNDEKAYLIKQIRELKPHDDH